MAAPSAVAMSSGGALSPRLAELAKPPVRALPPAEQATELGLAQNGPGSLLREGNRVLVDVRFDHGAVAGLDALRAAGARVAAASRRYQTVTVAVAPASLQELAGVAGVERVSENRAPLIYGSGEFPSAAAVGAECEGGAVISEGVDQLHVAEARSKYGVSGNGVTVGVLSDSYNQATTAADESGPVATHASEDVASGDLPGPANACSGQKAQVNVLDDSDAEGEDEGRAMAQIVHDVAPKASLAFATAFTGEISFAQNIEKLAKPVVASGAGARVIVDDVVYFNEPFFQDGPVAVAVNKVAGDGVIYFSAAGNDNLFEGKNEIASWEAPSFRDSLTCPAALLALSLGHCMDFNPNPGTVDDTFGMTVAKGATLTVDLQWAEPWFGVHTDLDAYLLDSGGKLIAQEDTNNIGPTGEPVEVLQWDNTTGASKEVRLAVNRCFSACNPEADETKIPRLKLALLENGAGVTKTEYPVSKEGDTVGPTIFGHTAATGAASVAAVPYDDSSQPEKYSSRGPVTNYFGPVNGTTPAAPLGSPETIAKPDIAATDCGATTFFAFFVESEAAWRFCGTSAAAPHAAGVAALELDAEPLATVEQVREAQTTTASPVGSFTSNAVGAGLLNADKAIASLLPPSTVTITEHPASRTADSTPTFEFEANPPPLTCFIDTVSTPPCTSPYTVATPLADGPHTFEVEAAGGDKASFSFTVDTSPPTITFTERPPANTADATPTFGFASSEPAGFTCSIDKAPAKACSSPYAVASPLADGPHTFEITATDQVENSSNAVIAFSVDTHAPSVTLFNHPPERTADKVLTFEFASNEPTAFSCAIDEVPPQPCSSPHVLSSLSDGAHTFEVTATDLAGNVGHATAAFTIDTRPPNTFFAAHPRSTLRTRQRKVQARFRFGSNEAGVTFICKVDRDLLHFCDPTISRRFEEGRHTIRVKARDAVGNIDRTPAVFHFQVKRVGRR